MARYVVGLGSNLGDRAENLRLAVAALRRIHGGAVVCSPVYETDPVGPPQPLFLNAAALLEESRPPRQLLASLLAIEAQLGRVRTLRYGPRTIDLDVLWGQGVVCDEPDLRVPHPELTLRAFAMRPLLDLVPDAIDPRTGDSFRMPPEAAGTLRPTAITL